MEKTYNTPVRIAKLTQELAAAGVPVAFIGGPPPAPPDGPSAWVEIVAEAPEATVDAVVAAHDPSTPSAEETEVANSKQVVTDYAATYTAFLAEIEAQRTDLDGWIAETQANPTLNNLTRIVRDHMQAYRSFLGEQRRLVKAEAANLRLQQGPVGTVPAPDPGLPP